MNSYTFWEIKLAAGTTPCVVAAFKRLLNETFKK